MYGNQVFNTYFILGFGLCCILDYIAIGLKHILHKNITSQSYRWFFMHFIFNFIITIFGLKDLSICMDISKCATVPWYNGDMLYALVTSLHLYHYIFFKLTKKDIIHHVSTCLLSTPLIIYYHRNPTAVMAVWFISGFPGCIDYFLLWLVKMGYIKSEIEKKIYVWISVWIRAPGCIATVALQLGIYMISDTLSSIELMAIIWNTFITYSNGIYFMHDTLSSYYSLRR